MSSKDERIRGWAADKLLDRGMGKAREPKDDAESPLRSLPPEQQRQRIRELLAMAAAIQVTPDFRPAEVIEAAPGDNDDEKNKHAAPARSRGRRRTVAGKTRWEHAHLGIRSLPWLTARPQQEIAAASVAIRDCWRELLAPGTGAVENPPVATRTK
jgi:hypothetical protein